VKRPERGVERTLTTSTNADYGRSYTST
jgi:hypothetical protein